MQQGRKKQVRLSTKGTSRTKKKCPDVKAPGEAFLDTALYPSGLLNTARNCYCNAVLQCLFNLPQFQTIAQELYRVHPGICDDTCCSKSKHTTNTQVRQITTHLCLVKTYASSVDNVVQWYGISSSSQPGKYLHVRMI